MNNIRAKQFIRDSKILLCITKDKIIFVDIGISRN